MFEKLRSNSSMTTPLIEGLCLKKELRLEGGMPGLEALAGRSTTCDGERKREEVRALI